jgi:uncharacterized protein
MGALTLTNTLLLLAAGLWAGAQNALAGGGSFITLSALLVAGFDPRAANIISSVALYPGQVLSGVVGRNMMVRDERLSLKWLLFIGLAGGAIGALVLIWTPARTFTMILPWLVLFATAIFAWSSFGGGVRRANPESFPLPVAWVLLSIISFYGGYFGGGFGFMMIATLSLIGIGTRPASATKNVMAAVVNTASLVVFVLSPVLVWAPTIILGLGATIGGYGGVWLLRRIPELWLRIVVIIIGLLLTAGLLYRTYG